MQNKKPQNPEKPEHQPLPHQVSKKPKDPTDEDNENESDDADRWGNLPGRARENFTGLDSTKLPAKYKFLIEKFHKRIQDTATE